MQFIRLIRQTGIAVGLLAMLAGCTGSQIPSDIPAMPAETPEERLRSAIDKLDVDLASKALHAGADPNHIWTESEVPGDETAPLHLVATRGHLPLAKLLLEHNANVNLVAGGTTPLHRAVTMSNHPEQVEIDDQVALIELLVAEGADVNARNRLDQTPLDYAREDRVIAILKASGGRTTAEIQDQSLEAIGEEGGGIIGDIPDDIEELKRRKQQESNGGTEIPVESP